MFLGNPPPIPDGPFNPTNYSGTQINVWGGAPPPFVQGGTPGVVNLGPPGICNPYTTQYGYLTENMLQVFSRISLIFSNLMILSMSVS